MPGQRSVSHTKDEILSDTYGDFYREQERIKKFLQRIKEDDREKTRELLDVTLNQGVFDIDMVEVECCFPSVNEIEYFEFESTESAVDYFSKREKITNLLVLIYTGKEDIPFVEIGNILKALENAAVEDFDKMELLYVPVIKTPKGFLRLLVQM